jgi:L-rhamnose isomerase
MSKEEIVSYVEENAWEMKPTDSEYYESLGEELMERDIIRDKITNETAEVTVK